MSDRSDGDGEMAMTLLDRHIERLLTGQTPHDSSLASLTGLVDAMRSIRDMTAVDDGAVIVAQAAAIARKQSVAGPARAQTVVRRPRRWRLRRPLTVALAGALLFGMASVAVAADGALPGDLLYGIDRAMEKVGIADGGLDERLAEVGHLIAAERADEAMIHLAKVLDDADEANVELLAPRIEHHLQLAETAGGPLAVEIQTKVAEIRASIGSGNGNSGGNGNQGQGQDNPGQGNQD